MTHTLRIIGLSLLLGLTATACAAAAADEDPLAPGTNHGIDVGEPHPAAGMCLPDQPDCVDVIDHDTDPAPDITYRPIGVEDDVTGEGTVIGGGELIEASGATVAIGFWMGVEDCYAVQRIDVAETDTKVAVDITVTPRQADQVCIEIAEARSVTVELSAPLGERVLEVGGVSVER